MSSSKKTTDLERLTQPGGNVRPDDETIPVLTERLTLPSLELDISLPQPPPPAVAAAPRKPASPPAPTPAASPPAAPPPAPAAAVAAKAAPTPAPVPELNWTRIEERARETLLPVHVSATDTLSGLGGILYSIDGSEPDLDYDTQVVISDEGTTTLKYAAYDAIGNTSTVTTREVRIDDSAPASGDDAPSGWVNGPVAVHVAATDTLSGFSHSDYTLDGGEFTLYAGSIPVSGDGTHTIEYRSTDVVGNVEETRTAHVYIDDSAPEASDDAPTSWVNGPVAVHVSATDTLSGLGGIRTPSPTTTSRA